LVHGPIIWGISDRLYSAAGWRYDADHEKGLGAWVNAFPISKAGPMGLELAFLVPQLIILPITLWAAEIATKVFDEPSVRLGHWLYMRTLMPAED
jgi:hypothetical protein